MIFGYEQHCPKCKRQMSYEECAGFVLLACSCGNKYVLKDGWMVIDMKKLQEILPRVSTKTLETMQAIALAKAKGEEQ